MRYLLPLLVAWCLGGSAWAAVQASVSSTSVSPGDTVRLTLQRDGQSGTQPDLSPLRKDFDILGSGSSENLEIINGHISSTMQMTVLLSPKHGGKMVIPSLQWAGERSSPVEINVDKPAQTQKAGPQSADPVFLSTGLEPKAPYVQAAVMLTVRLYADQPLYQATLDFPAASDVIVKPFGHDRASNETRNGKHYQVIERKYLLFAQKSGRLTLEGPVLDAEIADGSANDAFGSMFGSLGAMISPTRHLHLRTNPIEMNVLPRPASINPWLPAESVTLSETWDNRSGMHAGDPLVRHLHLSARGLTGEQLPDPAMLMKLPDGIKAYPDQSGISNAPDGNTVLGGRDQKIALIATNAGRYVLPAVRLTWWDTLHNTRREATLPEETLDILPAVEPRAMPVSRKARAVRKEQPGKMLPEYRWLALGILFAIVPAWWYLSRCEEIPRRDEKPARRGSFKAFQKACRANDPQQARRHLLDWAGTIWPEDPPAGLNALARRMNDERLAAALRELDRACYANQAWRGLDLIRFPSIAPLKKKGSASALPRLYP